MPPSAGCQPITLHFWDRTRFKDLGERQSIAQKGVCAIEGRKPQLNMAKAVNKSVSTPCCVILWGWLIKILSAKVPSLLRGPRPLISIFGTLACQHAPILGTRFSFRCCTDDAPSKGKNEPKAAKGIISLHKKNTHRMCEISDSQ